MQPTAGDIHVNRPLTNISVAYMNQEQQFIADTVFPSVPVELPSNLYYKYNKGEWFRTEAQVRAPRTESVGSGWTMTTDSYHALVKAVHVDITDMDRATQDRPVIDLDRDGTLFVTRDMLLRRELDFVNTYFKAGVWDGLPDQTGASSAATNQFIQWNRASSVPVEDFFNARVRLGESTGYVPNVLVLGAYAYGALHNHAEILERIKYTQKGIVTLDLLAALFDIDKVVVPYVVQNTAAEGAPTAMSYIYGKSALLVYAAPNAGLLQPSGGYTFEWTGYLGAQIHGTRMKKFRMEAIASDRVECEAAYDMKVVSSEMGAFWKTVVQ
jgi:hypothetical protein